MNKKEIIFGAGCFWGMEERFRLTEGVLETEVGYAGGTKEDPTYEEVCRHDTGHAEVVRVVYDEDVVSTGDLIALFFASHDPTQIDRQGPDVGDQYRSVIFYMSDDQKELSEKLKADGEKKGGGLYATQILPAPMFYSGEEYHQKYLMKRGAPVCHI